VVGVWGGGVWVVVGGGGLGWVGGGGGGGWGGAGVGGGGGVGWGGQQRTEEAQRGSAILALVGALARLAHRLLEAAAARL